MHKKHIIRAVGCGMTEKRSDKVRSKRINEKFFDCYMETDRLCALKFDVPIGGVGEYINRLEGMRYIPGRDEVLPKLLRYRDIRNSFAHESGALGSDVGVTKSDIAWLKKFNRELYLRKDPFSAYLKSERRLERRKKLRRTLLILALETIAVLAFALWFILQNG